MNLLELLKKLKEIEPDKHYTEKSRSVVLSTPLVTKLKYASPWLRELKLIGAFSLASLIFFILLGGFSNSRLLTPFKLSNLDPVSLKAEADAIDIQVHLTDLTYTEKTGNKTTPPTASTLPPKVEKQAQNIGLPSATSSLSDFGIDDILEKLSN